MKRIRLAVVAAVLSVGLVSVAEAHVFVGLSIGAPVAPMMPMVAAVPVAPVVVGYYGHPRGWYGHYGYGYGYWR
jgi:hypothetical protein